MLLDNFLWWFRFFSHWKHRSFTFGV